MQKSLVTEITSLGRTELFTEIKVYAVVTFISLFKPTIQNILYYNAQWKFQISFALVFLLTSI